MTAFSLLDEKQHYKIHIVCMMKWDFGQMDVWIVLLE